MSCDGRACFRKGFQPPVSRGASVGSSIPVAITANGNSAVTNAQRPNVPMGIQRGNSDSGISMNIARRGNAARRALQNNNGKTGNGGIGTIPLGPGPASPAAISLSRNAARVAKAFDTPLCKMRVFAENGVEIFKGHREDPADRLTLLVKDSIFLIVERTTVNDHIWIRGTFVDPTDASLKEGWTEYVPASFCDIEPLRLMTE